MELKSELNKSVAIHYSHGRSQEVNLNGVTNELFIANGDTLPESQANIAYQLSLISGEITFKKTRKKELFIYGGGAGASLGVFPFGFLTLGINTKHLEFGSNILFGISLDDAKYSGEAIEYHSGLAGRYYTIESVDSKRKTLHSHLSSNIYTNLYFKGFGIGYSGTFALPWGLKKIFKYTKYEPGVVQPLSPVSINFPYITMQDISISYILKEKYQGKVGISQITGKSFTEELWTFNIGLGYTF